MQLLAKNKRVSTIVVLFIFFAVWRLWLFFNISHLDFELWNSSPISFWWGGLYQLVAIFGSIFGFIISKRWGGIKSVLGRSIFFISCGLMFQAVGQTIATYYVYSDIEALYPSFADIGFFGSVFFYIYGVVVLAQAPGLSISIKDLGTKIKSVLPPIIILVTSYYMFLQGYVFDWSNPLKTFLDFGYPLGQAFYIAIVVYIFLTLRRTWGGIIRNSIIFLLLAFFMQYVSDFTFLYETNTETYIPGGVVDIMYLISYFLMSLSLVYLGHTFSVIQSNSSDQGTYDAKDSLVFKSVDQILTSVILAIITKQEKITGQVAWEEARKVPGLEILDTKERKIKVTSDVKSIINELVVKYKELFGDLAVQVSKDAARHLLAELPKSEIPNKLQ